MAPNNQMRVRPSTDTPTPSSQASSTRLLAIVGIAVALTLVAVIAITLLPKGNTTGTSTAPVRAINIPPITYKTVAAADQINWTTHLGDNANTSYNSKETVLSADSVKNLQLAGIFNVGKTTPYVDTIVTGILYNNGVLYFGSWDGNLYAVDATSHTLLWKQLTGSFKALCDYPTLGISSNPAMDDAGILYVGGGNGNLYAMDTKNKGNVIWKTKLATPPNEYLWGSPMVANNSVYMGVASVGDCPLVQGRLHRIDPKTGDILATHKTTPDFGGATIWVKPTWDDVSKTVIIDTGNGVYDQSEGQSILQLDATTLDLKSIFRAPKGDENFGNADFGVPCQIIPNVAGQHGAVCHNKSGWVYAVNITPTGLKLAWKLKLGIGGLAPEADEADMGAAVFDGRYIYAGSSRIIINGVKYKGSITKIDPVNGKIVWQVPLTDLYPLAPLVGGNTGDNAFIVVPLAANEVPIKGALMILRASDGKVLFTYAASSSLYGAPTIANGHIYASTVAGNVFDFALVDKIPDTDFFNKNQSLDTKQWFWVNNDPAHAKSTAEGMQIDAAGFASAAAKNYLFEQMPTKGDFTFTVHMKYDPTLLYEQGGVWIQETKNSFLKIVKVKTGENEYKFELGGNIHDTDKPSIQVPDVLKTDGKDYYLLIQRFNGIYAAFYGLDDSNWTPIATFKPSVPFSPVNIGLFAVNNKEGSTGFGTATFISAIENILTNGG